MHLAGRRLCDHTRADGPGRTAAQFPLGAGWTDRGLEVVEREPLPFATVLVAAGPAEQEQHPCEHDSHVP